MLRRSVLVSGMLVVLIVSQATAQPRRGFGGRGFGGFGGSQGSSSTLLGMQEVLQELRLSDEQKAKVDQLLGALRDETRSMFGSFNFQDLSQQERQERFAEVRERTEEATKKAVSNGQLLLRSDRALYCIVSP